MIWRTGLVSPSRSTSGSMAFCTVSEAGYCRAPRPAAVITAFVTCIGSVPPTFVPNDAGRTAHVPPYWNGHKVAQIGLWAIRSPCLVPSQTDRAGASSHPVPARELLGSARLGRLLIGTREREEPSPALAGTLSRWARGI